MGVMNLRKSFQLIPKMTEILDIEHRKPVWIALSELYLDTELQEYTYQWMAQIILDSPYSWEEILQINKYEVFPVLIRNLLIMTGQWAMFNEEWLLGEIQKSLNNKRLLKRQWINLSFRLWGSLFRDELEKLKSQYELLREQQEAKQ